MKKPPRSLHSSDALAAAGRISKRQLTRWFTHGIVGPPPRRGPGVEYSDEQLLRARAAATLRGEIASLDEIRRRLDGAARADLERWAKGDATPAKAATAIASPVATAAYPAARYEHVELAPGLTLLVRSDCDPAVRRRAEEIYAGYGPSRR
jgi:DNA-binding transcriptional MerR regulator